MDRWKPIYHDLQTAKSPAAWLKIKASVDAAGTPKTLQQIKIKIKNLTSEYQVCRDNNRGTGNSPKYCKFYEDMDSILGTRDISNLPGLMEVGVINSVDDEESPESTSGADEVTKRSKKVTKINMFQELIELQKENLKAKREADERHENFMKELVKEQQVLEREEREKDRDFFLNLAKVLSHKN